MTKTKKVRVNLSAMTRVHYSALVEVPVEYNPELDMGTLAREIYDEVPFEEFSEDFDYCERGDCYLESVDSRDQDKNEPHAFKSDGETIERVK